MTKKEAIIYRGDTFVKGDSTVQVPAEKSKFMGGKDAFALSVSGPKKAKRMTVSYYD